jgi:hypothetical protein
MNRIRIRISQSVPYQNGMDPQNCLEHCYGTRFAARRVRVTVYVVYCNYRLSNKLTKHVDGMGLDPGLANLLVDSVALDVLDKVPGPDGEGDVGAGVPTAALRRHGSRVITLYISLHN